MSMIDDESDSRTHTKKSKFSEKNNPKTVSRFNWTPSKQGGEYMGMIWVPGWPEISRNIMLDMYDPKKWITSNKTHAPSPT